MYQRIMVAIDDSFATSNVLATAIDMAKQSGASLAICHAVDETLFAQRMGEIMLSNSVTAIENNLRGEAKAFLEQAAEVARTAGVAVEINTSGRDAPAGESMPGRDIVACLAAAGVPLTLGSDAHAPHSVGRHFAETVAELRDLGVRELVRFEARQKIAVPLSASAA